MNIIVGLISFGGQYKDLIKVRLNELGCNVIEINIENNFIDFIKSNCNALILSGGPDSNLNGNKEYILKLQSLDIPILGICYGMQLIAYIYGIDVFKDTNSEFNSIDILKLNKTSLFKNIPDRFNVWMSHRDSILIDTLSSDIPFTITHKTINGNVAAMEYKNMFLLQFHPEVNNSEYGKSIFKNFINIVLEKNSITTKISERKNLIDINHIIEETFSTVKEDEYAIVALSGGLDSIVSAILASRVFKDRLFCVFIDTGLLRKDEYNNFFNLIEEFNLNIEYYDYSKKFIDELTSITDSTIKRKTIGREFINAFQEIADKISSELNIEIKYLIQGTIKSDIVESGNLDNKTSIIKVHHNVGGVSENSFIILEPLSSLFKNSVRSIAAQLRLDRDLIFKSPFPGPGLAIRIKGKVTIKRINILREATYIVEDILKHHTILDDIWQIPVILLNDKSSGVKGDKNFTGYTIVLRPISTIDVMTAKYVKLPYTLLDLITEKIISNIKEVCRVVYDINNKPIATIEWE